LLPDLAQAGYSLESRQAILHRRRLDLVLRRGEERIIVELKVGAPNVGELLKQVLDYRKCFEATFPGQKASVVVISTRIPERTRKSLQEQQIHSLEITEEEVLSGLQAALPSIEVRRGMKLDGEDRVQEIRQLLSDEEFLRIPDGMDLAPPWNQFKIFLALFHVLKQKTKDPWMKSPYVQLYPQPARGNAALLYHVSVESAATAPVHIRKESSGWSEDFWARIKPFLSEKPVSRDKGKQTAFDHYAVKDWDAFAQALGL